MKRCSLLTVLIFILMIPPLFAATSLENSLAYTQASRVSLDSGFAATAAEYADTALVYCETLSDAWYLKTLAGNVLHADQPLSETIDTLEHAFADGAFWLNESEYDARMWLSELCFTTGKYARAAELLTDDSSVTQEKLLLLTKVWYALGDKEHARECVETGIQMYPENPDFSILFFKNENPEDVAESSLCIRLTDNVGLFDPTASDLYLYASKFVDDDTAARYIMLYGQYNATNPLYPQYAFEKGFLSFDAALFMFDSLCHDGMRYDQFSSLCSLATEEDYVCLYAFLDEFNGVLLFDTARTGLLDMTCSYRYGRPYTVAYDRDCDHSVDMLVSCDYGTPVSVQLPSTGMKLEYNRYPSITKVEFADPEITLDFARNASSWKAVLMEKAAFSTEDFAFYVPSLADPLEDAVPAKFYDGCSSIECTADDPEGCDIRLVMNGGKPVDVFYTVRGRLYAHAYFSDGKLLYRDVDMDGDGLYELSELYSYDAPEPDPALIGNRIFGTVADCFEIPRFSVLLSDGDGDGFYEYEETMNLDGTSEIVWF